MDIIGADGSLNVFDLWRLERSTILCKRTGHPQTAYSRLLRVALNPAT
jgi:hypothetical protein